MDALRDGDRDDKGEAAVAGVDGDEDDAAD
jgi:hypothetical protein